MRLKDYGGAFSFEGRTLIPSASNYSDTMRHINKDSPPPPREKEPEQMAAALARITTFYRYDTEPRVALAMGMATQGIRSRSGVTRQSCP